jgi:transcriptional regulator with XRE-family HTH domain
MQRRRGVIAVPQAIGQNIKRLRTEQSLTQQALASLLNVSPKTVSKWETGTGAPDISQVVPLALAFGVTTDEMLIGKPGVADDDADAGLSAAEMNVKAFAKIFDVYGVRLNTICEAAGVDEQTVRDVLVSGEFSKRFADAAETRRLGLILAFLSRLIEKFSEEKRLLIPTLCAKLSRENYITNETIARYAKLDPEVLDAYLSGYGSIPAKDEYSLVVVLFLLDGLLNREEAFPWG